MFAPKRSVLRLLYVHSPTTVISDYTLLPAFSFVRFYLQVVTFLHTVLLSEKLQFRTALVVCPLNTVLNWVSEFKKWQRNMGQDKVKVCKPIKMY